MSAKLLLKIFLPILSALFVSGCNSSDNGGGPADANKGRRVNPDAEYPLTFFQIIEEETDIFRTNMKGRAADVNGNGTTLTAVVVFKNRKRQMYESIDVIRQIVTVSLGFHGTVKTSSYTRYIGTTGHLIAQYYPATDVTCQPVMPDKFPDIVKLGDSGVLSTLMCSDGTSYRSEWTVTDGGSGNIALTVSAQQISTSETTLNTGDEVYIINLEGKVVGFEMHIEDFVNQQTITLKAR
ncbi:Uncharacterised protein [BD1-7 clade bacterium]|uniref:Lipoprotein n=1 Tax=BD1-7 clade bacterium TaxID=2029982 RepID=A0A5S9PQF1_9GAMM|nr:Uncharacterised protein [BD1-7 clade bacterium]